MNIEKLIKELQDTQISADNLLLAITKLLEILHNNDLDKDAISALAECGITLEIKNA